MKQAKQCAASEPESELDELRPARRAAHDAGQHYFLEEVSSWLRECYLGPEELNA